MKTIYHTLVTKVGDLFNAFIDEKILIMFKDNAPEELLDYCILHNENSRKDDIKPGDILVIEEEEYLITAVGRDAIENLDNLGHITLKFDGNNEAKLPGTIHVENKAIKDIDVGATIKVIRR
ncbi:PTS glucitol/sorbitol transporter subunit IIA [Clostridium sp. Cult2]|uniref:PTS glucitol/sorbitol transporter subunit IIA n=1 Tax=Clostridium sp. Cult2 TaxID=2079003 RepID=UPI001F2F6A9E|nr:PTS glucitol/sorbitol transporter subunit IIA [Clostridium sp. Cult2]MCF6466181.1 PTS sorbitol transporter subunit IIA [Clostridium sp. Cult2]